MIDSRRWPRPTPSARKSPSSSGPRCTMASRIRMTAASVIRPAPGPGGLTLITPQMPHMRSRSLEHGLFVHDDPVRRLLGAHELLALAREPPGPHGQHATQLTSVGESRVQQLAAEDDAVGAEHGGVDGCAEQEIRRAAHPYGEGDALVATLALHDRSRVLGTQARREDMHPDGRH